MTATLPIAACNSSTAFLRFLDHIGISEKTVTVSALARDSHHTRATLSASFDWRFVISEALGIHSHASHKSLIRRGVMHYVDAVSYFVAVDDSGALRDYLVAVFHTSAILMSRVIGTSSNQQMLVDVFHCGSLGLAKKELRSKVSALRCSTREAIIGESLKPAAHGIGNFMAASLFAYGGEQFSNVDQFLAAETNTPYGATLHAFKERMDDLQKAGRRLFLISKAPNMATIVFDGSQEYGDEGQSYWSLSSVTLTCSDGTVFDMGNDIDAFKDSSAAYAEYHETHCEAGEDRFRVDEDIFSEFLDWVADKLGCPKTLIATYLEVVYEYAQEHGRLGASSFA